MARSTQEIFDLLITDKNADSNLDDFDSVSQTAVWRSFLFVVAQEMNLFEQLLDIATADITEIVNANRVGTCTWLRGEALKFQFDLTTPQIIELIDFVPTYPVFDESLQIITAAAVVEGTDGVVTIKVAKGTAPALTSLDPAELTAFTTYIKTIKVAGVQVQIISANADRIRIEAEIFYNGEVGKITTTANVIAAIDTFGAQFTEEEFNGVVLTQKLVDAIQLAVGVEDILIIELKGRPASVALGVTPTFDRKYLTFAGYFVTEDGIGDTINDTLTFTRFTDV